jgi:hypothetical protein
VVDGDVAAFLRWYLFVSTFIILLVSTSAHSSTANVFHRYVAMHAMQEDSGGHDHAAEANGFADGGATITRKQQGPRMQDTLATVVGMLLPLLTQFGHHHH